MKGAVEAVLFAAGRYVDEDFIAKSLQEDVRKIRKALTELREDYEKREGCAIRVSQEGKNWKLAVRDEYLGVASKLVSDKEIATTVLETLGVIAWKNPIMQSELIKIRGPAAYEHIAELAERGFVTKVALGRSFKITLLDKFFDYFDVEGREDLRKLFQPIEDQATQAQADIDAKQADYDAKTRQAQQAVSGANPAEPAATASIQPSAQKQVQPATLVEEIKAAADLLERAEEADATDISIQEPPPAPLVKPEAPTPTLETQRPRVAGTGATAEAIAAAEQAVEKFGKDLGELKKEIDAEATPPTPTKHVAHPHKKEKH